MTARVSRSQSSWACASDSEGTFFTEHSLRGRHMAAKKPNIVIIWGDDIGQTNISATRMA
jgi:hypothetical protein